LCPRLYSYFLTLLLGGAWAEVFAKWGKIGLVCVRKAAARRILAEIIRRCDRVIDRKSIPFYVGKMWLLLCLGGVLGCASGGHHSVGKTDRARMLVEIANGALLEGDPVGALQQLARAQELDHSLPELHHSKALAYHKRQDALLALFEAKEAVRLKPDYSDANNTLGKLLMDQGRSEEALVPLNLAAHDSLYRDSYKAWTNLGILYYQKKEYDRAKEHLNQAIVSGASHACVAYYYRGLVFFEQGRLQESISDYQQATRKFCAGYADAVLALGLAYQKNRQIDLARQVYLEIQERYPHTDFADRAMKKLQELP